MIPRQIRLAKFITSLLLVSLLLNSEVSFARPVSFLGGWTLMSENRADQNELMAGYTLLPDLSLSAHISANRLNSGDRQFAEPMASYLVQRWNENGTQANLYLFSGYGVDRTQARSRGSFSFGAEADIETRKLYFSTKYELLGITSGAPLEYYRLRGGFAPYLAGFEGLHTWGILQIDHRNWTQRFSVTPMLRFFYRNVLFELGSSFTGEWNFNWVVEI